VTPRIVRKEGEKWAIHAKEKTRKEERPCSPVIEKREILLI
jgi:hypothetical protein